jgi:hypothetical protein
MKTIEFTKEELRALLILIDENPCNRGCCYPELESKDISCHQCPFTIATYSILEKIKLDK